jgi:hypothetical protein
MIKTELVETKSISRPKGTYTEFEQLQWVANKTLPPVDSEVTVKINGIGRFKGTQVLCRAWVYRVGRSTS